MHSRQHSPQLPWPPLSPAQLASSFLPSCAAQTASAPTGPATGTPASRHEAAGAPRLGAATPGHRLTPLLASSCLRLAGSQATPSRTARCLLLAARKRILVLPLLCSSLNRQTGQQRWWDTVDCVLRTPRAGQQPFCPPYHPATFMQPPRPPWQRPQARVGSRSAASLPAPLLSAAPARRARQ